MIETKGLRKEYGSFAAIHSLDLRVGRGEIFGFVGPNGAGKSTTIRILAGLLAATSGEATVSGKDVIADPRSVRGIVGYMPDTLQPYEGMRVWEYLDFFGAAYGLSRKTRRTRVNDVMDITGTIAMRDYHVDSLSHGMRQRVGVARSLVHDPEVLFLDEPTNGLDPRARVEMRKLLSELKGRGKTILISSHILPELSTLSDQVGFIESGKLVACGSVRDVQRQVHTHRVFEVEFLEDACGGIPAVEGMLSGDQLLKTEPLENLLRIELKADNDEIILFLKALVNADLSVLGFREIHVDLEEAFLTLTADESSGRRSSGTSHDDS